MKTGLDFYDYLFIQNINILKRTKYLENKNSKKDITTGSNNHCNTINV